LEAVFLEQARNPQNWAPTLNGAFILSCASQPLLELGPVTNSSVVGHLKYHFAKVLTRWNTSQYSTQKAKTLLQRYLYQHPIPRFRMGETDDSTDIVPEYSHTAMMVRGFQSNRPSPAELELQHELSLFSSEDGLITIFQTH
jgi:hypothetical protein